MSHDLHSLIDQAVERTKQSTAPRPKHSARELVQSRVSGWQAELARFTGEFQQDMSALLEDVTRLSAEAGRIESQSPAVAPESRRMEDIPLPQTGPVPAARQTNQDQEQDRFAALKERLSRQLSTGMTTSPTATPASSAPQKGAQP